MLDYAKSWAWRLTLNTFAIGLALGCGSASAQITAQQITAIVLSVPVFINPAPGVTDLGNGPIELRIAQGNARFATSSGSGVAAGTSNAPPAYTGSGTLTVVGFSTQIVLNVTPTTAPCVGCLLSASVSPSLTPISIPAGAFISAYSGTLITMSTNVQIPAQTPLAWGSACPTTPGPVIPLQASVGGDTPFFTTARICAYGTNTPGAAVIPFAIGGH
jgi:hypothetical protein